MYQPSVVRLVTRKCFIVVGEGGGGEVVLLIVKRLVGGLMLW